MDDPLRSPFFGNEHPGKHHALSRSNQLGGKKPGAAPASVPSCLPGRVKRRDLLRRVRELCGTIFAAPGLRRPGYAKPQQTPRSLSASTRFELIYKSLDICL